MPCGSSRRNLREQYEQPLKGLQEAYGDKSTKGAAKVKPELAEPVKEMIEAEPSFSYRTAPALPETNSRTEARVPRPEGPDQHWVNDLCRVWDGKDGWLGLALVINCGTRQLLG